MLELLSTVRLDMQPQTYNSLHAVVKALLASISCVLLECSWVDLPSLTGLLSNVVQVTFLVNHFLSPLKLNELLCASKDPL